MEKAEFEQRFLALVNQTDVVITAPNIAYHLKIPIEEAQEQLLGLELNGVIHQDGNAEGQTAYTMPNRPTPGTLPARISDGQQSADAGLPGVHDPANLPPAPIYGGPATAPVKGRNINGLVLNILFPGLGSLICGHMVGAVMMAMVLLGVILIFGLSGWSRLWGLLPIIIAWGWSLLSSERLLDQREPPPGASQR